MFGIYKAPAAYDLIDGESSYEKNNVLGSNKGKGHRGPSTLMPWLLAILFAASTAYLLWKDLTLQYTGTFETGFNHELAAARHLIELSTKKFSGSPIFNPDGSEFVPEKHNEPQYVGEPSDEIDNAWDALTEGRYFRLAKDEAREAWGPSYEEFWNEDFGGYLTGFDMFHTLHCLNHIRMAFHPDRYPQPPIHGLIHREHCIDHLRQMIMCNGDMTPIPTRYHAGIDGNYIDSDRPHTCRNFQVIRDWTTERFNGSLMVPFQRRGYH